MTRTATIGLAIALLGGGASAHSLNLSDAQLDAVCAGDLSSSLPLNFSLPTYLSLVAAMISPPPATLPVQVSGTLVLSPAGRITSPLVALPAGDIASPLVVSPAGNVTSPLVASPAGDVTIGADPTVHPAATIVDPSPKHHHVAMPLSQQASVNPSGYLARTTIGAQTANAIIKR